MTKVELGNAAVKVEPTLVGVQRNGLVVLFECFVVAGGLCIKFAQLQVTLAAHFFLHFKTLWEGSRIVWESVETVHS